MALTAIRGALGFLSRLPIGRDERAWMAFTRQPVAFPLAGYLLGLGLAVPLFVLAPATSAAFFFVAWVYLLTGINHLDGVADCGDALVVHGNQATRREVLTDTTVGVGGVVAVVIVITGLATAALGLAAGPWRLLSVVVATEVGAKLGMAALAGLGESWHDGLGAAFTAPATRGALIAPVLVALPAMLLSWPHPIAAAGLLFASAPSLGILWWGRRRLGGINGDLFGLANELGRVVGLHAGVIAWMLW